MWWTPRSTRRAGTRLRPAAGFALDNVALIVAGTLVGSSGTILTLEMATAMNRSVGNILFAGFGGAPAALGPVHGGGEVAGEGGVRLHFDRAKEVILEERGRRGTFERGALRILDCPGQFDHQSAFQAYCTFICMVLGWSWEI